MLKEELEKQIGCEFSQKAYAALNADYEKSDFNNNVEYCDALKTDRVFMTMVEEVKDLRDEIHTIKQVDTNVAHILMKLSADFSVEDRKKVDVIVAELIPYKEMISYKLWNALSLNKEERMWVANYIDNAVEL